MFSRNLGIDIIILAIVQPKSLNSFPKSGIRIVCPMIERNIEHKI